MREGIIRTMPVRVGGVERADKPTPTFSWDEIDQIRSPFDQTIQPEEFTVLLYAERYNISRSTAKRQLTKLVKSGQLKVRSVGVGTYYYKAAK